MQTFKTFIDSWTDLIGTSISGLLLTTATAIFFYSIVRFIMNRSSGDAKGLEDAKSMMGWSIIGLTVMFSIWGIVSFLQTGILGSNNKSDIVAPSVKLNTQTQTQSQTQRTNSTVNSNTSVNTGTNSNYSNEGRGSVPVRPLVGAGGSCRIDIECENNLICNAVNVCAARGR